MNATDELSLNDLTRQLGAVRDQLLRTRRDDFPEVYRLKKEQDRLRRLAKKFAADSDDYRTSEDLMAELTTRREALERIRRESVYVGGTAEVNIEMHNARGTTSLTQRISHLEDILTKRGLN